MSAIDYFFAEQNTEQTTASTSFVDIDATDGNAAIASSHFTAGKKYLLCITAQGNEDSSGNMQIQTLHGSTAFETAQSLTDMTTTTGIRFIYSFMTVWTAVAAEGIKLQYLVTTGNAFVDQIALLMINLSDNLTENTDWFFNERANDDALSTTPVNGATITFTPGTAGQDWLVLSYARMDPSTTTDSFITRIERSGEATSATPEARNMMGSVNRLVTNLLARAYNLGTASNTFTEVSAATASAHTRLHSNIFALNLNKFRNHSVAYTDADLALGTSDFGTELQTMTLSPDVTGPVWILAYWGADTNSLSSNLEKSRIQVDNADQPSGQTTDAYQLRVAATSATDESPITQHTLATLSNASHTIDLDGSSNALTGTPAAQHRTLIAVTMELAAVGGVTIEYVSPTDMQRQGVMIGRRYV